MKRTFTRAIILTSASLVAIGVALFATLGAGARGSTSAAHSYATGKALGGHAFFSHGRLQYPKDIANQFDNLNGVLDSCYLSHGATKVASPDGSWTYSDPGSVAQPACVGAQDAVNAFANGPEMAGFSVAVAPLTRAFWACMIATGVVPPLNVDGNVDTTTTGFKTGADACSTKANNKIGVSP